MLYTSREFKIIPFVEAWLRTKARSQLNVSSGELELNGCFCFEGKMLGLVL